MAETTTLAAAILDAQRAVQSVPKDARNEFSNYDYASAESIITEARRALHAAGLTVYRREWSMMVAGETPYVLATFVLACGSEEQLSTCPFPVVEGKGKPLDKALATALTSGLAYWLRDLLLIPRCGEEMDTRDDAAHEPKPRARKPATKLPPPTNETTTSGPPPVKTANEDSHTDAVAPSGGAAKPIGTTAVQTPPRTLAQLGNLMLIMAGGDKSKASDLCNDLLGVPTLREFKGYLPDAIETVWGAHKDSGGAGE